MAAQVVDTCSLARCPHHDGKEESRPEFFFKFQTYMALLGWSGVMESYCEEPGYDLIDGLGRCPDVEQTIVFRSCSGAERKVTEYHLAAGGAPAWPESVEGAEG